MGMESEMEPQLPTPPEEIRIEPEVLKVSVDGKRYSYEKGGQFYGGDYLAEPPVEIGLGGELPPPPPETAYPAL